MKELGRVGQDRPGVSTAWCPTWAGCPENKSHRAASVITERRHQPAAGNTT